MDCIFCKIVAGEIPAEKIWEDETFLSFLDVNPLNPGHLLVIPKKHTEYLFDMPDTEYSELMIKAKEAAIRMKEKLGPKKVGLVVEGFGVPHVHVHLIPINNPHELNPERAKKAAPEELKQIAGKLVF